MRMDYKKPLAVLLVLTAFTGVIAAQASKTALTFQDANIDMNRNNITGLPTTGISTSSHAVSKGFSDTEYLNRDGDSMTGILDMLSNNITNVDEIKVSGRVRGLSNPTASGDAVSKGYADTTYLNRDSDSMNGNLDMNGNDILNLNQMSGTTVTGQIDMSNNQIKNVANPTSSGDAMSKGFADSEYLDRDGDSMTGILDMTGNEIRNALLGDSLDADSNRIVNLADASASGDAINLGQGDTRWVNRGGDSMTGNLSMGGNSINNVNVLNANNKNFVQSINSTHEAVYTSQESRTARAVVEGSVTVYDTRTVELPKDFTAVASDTYPQVYVQATPHSLANVAVVDRSTSSITIQASEDTVVDYRVTAVRDGYEDKTVVRPQ